LRIKKRNAIGNAGRINYSPFSNRTEEEAEAVVPASPALTPKRASLALSAAKETTATFNLTHKRDKSNIIYQKTIKN
jgi:hypothetical protein